jgi:RNA polymerase sigma factor (sigma-70 family)
MRTVVADVLAVLADADERQTDVADLVDGALAGDPAAWRALVDRYTPLLWQVIRRYRLDSADAADVMQDTWLRLLENLPKLREPRAVGGWLRTTAQRESQHLRQRARRTEPVAELDDLCPPSTEPIPGEAIERSDQNWRVRAAVGRLPSADQRFLTVLMSSPEPTYREVASTLDRPIGSIGPTRARCLSRLQRELAGAGVDALN